VHLQVDEAGRHDEAGGVDAIGLDHHVTLIGADARDATVDDHYVGDAVLSEGGVDHAAVVDSDGGYDRSSTSVSPGSTRPESR